MDVKKIKLRKNRLDEYRVAHVFDEGTKYLKAGIYFTKHYGYSPHQPDGGYFPNDQHLSTLKDVKQWIADYDDYEDARLAAKAEEEAIEQAKYDAERAAEQAATDAMKNVIDVAPVVAVDDFVEIMMGRFSKPNLAGEGLVKADKYNAKVVKIINITNEEFDAAADGLYHNFPNELLIGSKGGFESADPRIKDLTYDQVFGTGQDQNKRIFRETMYVRVHAVVAPNRQVLYVNTEGYDYVRYVAIAA